MVDPLLSLLAVAVTLVAVDLLLAGGLMTMTGVSTVAEPRHSRSTSTPWRSSPIIHLNGGSHPMTTEAHDHGRSAATAAPADAPRSRPRWLIPVLLLVIAGVGLVLAGVVSASTAIGAGLIGGMLLMHLGGHGGHGASGPGRPG